MQTIKTGLASHPWPYKTITGDMNLCINLKFYILGLVIDFSGPKTFCQPVPSRGQTSIVTHVSKTT